MVNHGKHFYTILIYLEVDDEVHMDHFPWILWDFKGLTKSCCFFLINLDPLTFHTLLAVLLYSLINLWPLESFFAYFKGSFLAKMSSLIMHLT